MVQKNTCRSSLKRHVFFVCLFCRVVFIFPVLLRNNTLRYFNLFVLGDACFFVFMGSYNSIMLWRVHSSICSFGQILA